MLYKTVVLPDIHLDDSGYSKSYQLVKDFLTEYKPNQIVLLGDFMDCTSVSHWLENKHLTLENKRFLKEVAFANKELDYLQKWCKNIVYLEGNHEYWVNMYIEKNPQLQGILELPTVLDLEKRNIKWVELNKLYKLGKVYFTHGYLATKYHATKMLHSYGCSIIYGHTHNTQSAQLNMKMQEPIMAWGLGCLCSHSPEYRKNMPSNWIDQFGILESDDTGRFNFYPVNITDGQFIYGGKLYK